MKKLVAILLCFSTVLSMVSAICYAKEFPDVAVDHWAYPYIDKLSNEGIINGYNDGTYKPQGTVKRSEFLKLVMTSCMPKDINWSEEVPKPFDHWAAPYVYMGEQYNVIPKGEYTLENIEEPITRLEMARMVANADLNVRLTPLKVEEFDEEADEEEIDENEVILLDLSPLDYQDIVLINHCVLSGLIKGYDDYTFKPDKTMTRAEAATMIYRFVGAE